MNKAWTLKLHPLATARSVQNYWISWSFAIALIRRRIRPVDYMRPSLANKPDRTVKIRVVAVCDAGVSGGLGLCSFWSDTAQRKMGVNERAVWVFLPRKKMQLLNFLYAFTSKEKKILCSLIFFSNHPGCQVRHFDVHLLSCLGFVIVFYLFFLK